MGALVDHLEAMLRRGCSERELVQAVQDELMGGDLLDDELADEARALDQAAERERELLETIGRASARSGADREALRLTLLYAHRGGLYLPGEEAAPDTHRGTGWLARESVRFACFTVIARLLVRRLESGAMPSTDYPSAVSELATRLSRVSVHVPRRRQ